MTKTTTSILLSALTCFLIGCSGQTKENNDTGQENQWQLEKRVSKKIDNLHFSFPSEGHAYDNRDFYVNECIDAVKENCAAIELTHYSDPMKITFLNSRAEMEEEVGMAASGWTNMWTRELHIVANNEFLPPIKHEIMHMISMNTWGYPHDDLIWINEGLATNTLTHCNGHTVGEIYRYFIAEEKLVSIDSLTNDFHGVPSIISYHQSAHIVEYLLTNYGLEKFKELWERGFSSFEEIYSLSFSQIEEEIKKEAMEKYPTPVGIDWDVFSEGCY